MKSNIVASASESGPQGGLFGEQDSEVFIPSNVEGFGIMRLGPNHGMKPNRFALNAIKSVIEANLPGEDTSDQSDLVVLPDGLLHPTNFAKACWIASALLPVYRNVGIVDLNKANQITTSLDKFMERLAVNHFGGLVVADPDFLPEASSGNVDMLRRIAGSQDDKPVLNVTNSGLQLLSPITMKYTPAYSDEIYTMQGLVTSAAEA